MPHSLRPQMPPLATAEQQAIAKVLAGNPATYAHLPNFEELRNTAWWTLKAAQLARQDARRHAVRRIGPGDAA